MCVPPDGRSYSLERKNTVVTKVRSYVVGKEHSLGIRGLTSQRQQTEEMKIFKSYREIRLQLFDPKVEPFG